MIDDVDAVKDLENPAIWKEKGNELFNQEEYQKAIECYNHAIKLDENYIPAWNNLGFTLLKIGKIDEAKNVNKKIKELKQKNTDNFANKQLTKESTPSEIPPYLADLEQQYVNGEINVNQYQRALKRYYEPLYPDNTINEIKTPKKSSNDLLLFIFVFLFPIAAIFALIYYLFKKNGYYALLSLIIGFFGLMLWVIIILLNPTIFTLIIIIIGAIGILYLIFSKKG